MRRCGMLVVIGAALAGAWLPILRAAAPAGGEMPPVLAHWRLDEIGDQGTLRDSGPNACDALITRGAQRITLRGGVEGNALALAGDHLIRVVKPFDVSKVTTGIAFSAWVIPTELGSYREIFRKEDGDRRLLFSFQDHGKILSLGLNIAGAYVECDARIDPKRALNGKWHHCAATFDGRWMRVYLDGDEVGALERPGAIQAGGAAPACLGSSNGGECFQGALDDLRLYAAPLSPAQVAALFRDGRQRVDARFAQVLRLSERLCPIRETFTATLADARRALVEKKALADVELRGAIVSRIRLAFGDEADRFVQTTGMQPGEFLASPGDEFHANTAGRLVELMLEYKPLTPQQWKRAAPEDAAKWRQAEAIAQQFEQLSAQGPQGQCSPKWIELMMEAGSRIAHRPFVQERVAPYVKPQTPATRDYTADEARQLLEADWLHQADGHPTPQRIADEIRWARRLAVRLANENVSFARDLAALGELEKALATLKKEDAPLYFKVRQLKRAIALRNPAIDFDQVLLVDMPYPQGSEWNHETRHRLGYMAVPGARLLVLKGLGPDGHIRQLMPQAPLHGSFWRPDVSWDGKQILFCFKPHNEKSFHLYEIDADGSNLRQLTDGPYDDLDPIYLPDGRHLLFTTTRGHTYVRCMPPTNAFVLARADRDGQKIYLVSSNNEPDYLPSVMNDGRIVYTRWEYTDKPLWRAQKLWTINPDGSQVSTLWGNQSVWPDVMKDARAIPGSRRLLFTGSAHHNWFAGSIGIVDPELGLNFPDGLMKVTADVAWPECGNGPVDPIESPAYHRAGNYPAYYSPYPLSEQDFLVSANRGGQKFALYLMDVEGNRELVYEGANHIFHAMPLKARRRPPIIPQRVSWPAREDRDRPDDGVIFSSNVYQGAPPELRGRAKFLRIWHIDPKTYTYWHKRPYISTGPVVSTVQSEGVKRLLGTVPIEADGSVAFHAPPGVSLHFQLLDEQERALQTMRSFVNVMPGEYRGCLGCHESHSRAPISGQVGRATSQPPSAITLPPWPDTTVSYPRYVKPVLDKYCGKCHQGEGEAVKACDLTDRPGALGFSEPYHLLTGRPTWGKAYVKPANPPGGFGIAGMLMIEGYGQLDPQAYKTPRPLTALSYASRLVDLASSGKHYEVKVDPTSRLRLIAWVDAMCPYNGEEEIRAIPDPVFQGIDWLSIRPRIQSAPRITRPGPVD